jgi:hypothetical protein
VLLVAVDDHLQGLHHLVRAHLIKKEEERGFRGVVGGAGKMSNRHTPTAPHTPHLLSSTHILYIYIFRTHTSLSSRKYWRRSSSRWGTNSGSTPGSMARVLRLVAASTWVKLIVK